MLPHAAAIHASDRATIAGVLELRRYEASGYGELGRALDRTGFEVVLYEKRLDQPS